MTSHEALVEPPTLFNLFEFLIGLIPVTGHDRTSVSTAVEPSDMLNTVWIDPNNFERIGYRFIASTLNPASKLESVLPKRGMVSEPITNTFIEP